MRLRLRDYLQAQMPSYAATLRSAWADPSAFPDLPSAAQDAYRAGEGGTVDRWPLVEVAIESARVTRAETQTITPDPGVTYFVLYSATVTCWVNVTPDAVGAAAGTPDREIATTVRDDLLTLMRVTLLDRVIGGDPPMLVLPNTYSEDYGVPIAAKGQRFEVGGRARLQLRVQERITEPALVTVDPDQGQALVYDVEVSRLPDHPALA